MKDGYFINEAIEQAIITYINSSKNPDGILYNSFLVVTIRILDLIYGRLDILNPYYLNNSVAFLNNLAKYGMNKTDIALFKEEFLSYYKFELANDQNCIKEKNPYFKSTLQFLIDMFLAKKKTVTISFQEEEMFLDLIYTSHSTNPYRISYAYLMLDDITIPEKYYYSKLNQLDVTREFNQTISTTLNLDALNIMGVNLSHLKEMSNSDIVKAKNDAYQYFLVDATSPNREEELKEKVNYYKMYGRQVSTGNGYVDILLLMSVIVTSISIISIIVFSLMQEGLWK